MRVAVIGVGRWGINHVRVLTEIMREGREGVGVEDVVVADISLARAREVAKLYSLEAYTNDLEDLVKAGVDAVIVAVPTLYHYEVVMKLLPHADVLVEKPIAARLEEAEEMVKLAEREGRILAVGHIMRFNPVVPALKDRLAESRSEITYIAAQRVGPGPAGRHSLNLGVAHDLLVHDVDVVCFLLDSLPSLVYASAVWEPSYPYETEITALYSFKELGVIADLRASWRVSPNFKKRAISVQLKDRVFEADYILQTITVERGLVEHRSRGRYADIVSAYTSRIRETWSMLGAKREPLLLEDLHFLHCVKRKEEPLNSGEVGLKALKCILAALKSARRHSPVEIEWP